MSTANGTVTPGYTFTYDAEGKAQITKDRLNLLGAPTVTVALANTVALVDLTAAVKALLPKIGITVGAVEGDGTIKVTAQVQDADGNSLSNEYCFNAWMSDSELGAPHAMTTDFSLDTGVLIKEVTTDALLKVQTNSSGTAVFEINDGAGTVYFMAEINGLVFNATVVIT